MLKNTYHTQKYKYELSEVINVLRLIPSIEHISTEIFTEQVANYSPSREHWYELREGKKCYVRSNGRYDRYYPEYRKRLEEFCAQETFYALEYDTYWPFIEEYGIKCLYCDQIRFEEARRYGRVPELTAPHRYRLCGHYLNKIPLLCNACSEALSYFIKENDTLEIVMLRHMAITLGRECKLMQKEISNKRKEKR